MCGPTGRHAVRGSLYFVGSWHTGKTENLYFSNVEKMSLTFVQKIKMQNQTRFFLIIYSFSTIFISFLFHGLSLLLGDLTEDILGFGGGGAWQSAVSPGPGCQDCLHCVSPVRKFSSWWGLLPSWWWWCQPPWCRGMANTGGWAPEGPSVMAAAIATTIINSNSLTITIKVD